ncbi:30S ribosome-binding factor RbfA [Methylovirgula sp. 4M-Z18]|uniref:30S ribosome-binding factor RbfA n=1 Tax=Methylovirgula sp. 4M-Z18 TaxID=2293567 RepID=UPI000E2F7FAD|nr:30S ribosome-binding factor RbfA [Methylovirgula sp. 4M-Z18]RFB77931.1 30S ribosome-binding factor RbfA [Methylovirgula sp. 4M-Z18]
MSRQHHNGGEPSQRMLRVAELVRQVMSELLARGDINDPILTSHVISVPQVRMSPDLKLATIYVMPLGGKDVKEVVQALESHKKYLRGEISQKINMKFAPEIRFRADEAFQQGARIDEILNSDKVKRDTAQPDDEADPSA